MYISESGKTELHVWVKAFNELYHAAKKFAPNDQSVHAFDALSRDDGKPRVYTVGINDEPLTDHDYMRLHTALEAVKKLTGEQ